MKITSEIIPLIEKALGFKLFPWQVDYLLNDTPFPDICPCLINERGAIGKIEQKRIRTLCVAHFDDYKRCYYKNRQTGFTTVHCIKLALSNGDSIYTRKMEMYSDRGNGSTSYARSYYRNMFIEIWSKLKSARFPVREVIF